MVVAGVQMLVWMQESFLVAIDGDLSMALHSHVYHAGGQQIMPEIL